MKFRGIEFHDVSSLQARYDELAENIHLYYHLNATIDQDVKEFEQLHFLLGKDREAA